MITLTVKHPEPAEVSLDLSGLEGLTADKAAEVLRERHPGIEIEVELNPNLTEFYREIPFTEVLEAAVDAHPPIPTPPMPPYAGHTFTVEAPVDDMPRVIAELTAALEPHADAIDRAQIAALGGYPADLCGVWERSKL